jgi:hypothetical protein
MLAATRITCIAAAAISIALLAGCGGGGSTSTGTAEGGEELTKAEVIAEGDAICKDAHDRFADLRQNPPTTAEGAATLTQQLVEINETELSQLRELDAPASIRSDLARYLDALEKNVATLKEGLAAAQQNDATAYAKAQAKAGEDQVERLQLAHAVGFKECSRPASAAPAGTG